MTTSATLFMIDFLWMTLAHASFTKKIMVSHHGSHDMGSKLRKTYSYVNLVRICLMIFTLQFLRRFFNNKGSQKFNANSFGIFEKWLRTFRIFKWLLHKLFTNYKLGISQVIATFMPLWRLFDKKNY